MPWWPWLQTSLLPLKLTFCFIYFYAHPYGHIFDFILKWALTLTVTKQTSGNRDGTNPTRPPHSIPTRVLVPAFGKALVRLCWQLAFRPASPPADQRSQTGSPRPGLVFRGIYWTTYCIYIFNFQTFKCQEGFCLFFGFFISLFIYLFLAALGLRCCALAFL